MKKIAVLSAVFLLTLACGGGAEQAETAAAEAPAPEEVSNEPAAASAVATIEAKSDSGVSGSATFTEVDGQVMLTLEIAGATPGEHAFHLHEIGDCSAADGTSAGGHWNPTGDPHGQWGVDGFHLGDVGNLVVDEEGNASLTVATNLWSIGTGDDNDVVGRAVIVHAGVDDFSTQPTGAAGGRIGCGVIELAAAEGNG